MISLQLSAPPQFPLDLSSLLPEHLSTLSLDAIKRLMLSQGRQAVSVGELFKVKGTPDDTLEILGVTPNCFRLGRAMRLGKLIVHGTCGDECGRELHGGTLSITGDVGDFAGAAMRSGTLEITGSARDFIGAPIDGSTSGMKGGSILISGNAGKRLGDRMRRGFILVGGNTDAAAASQLIAGTIVVLGSYGAQLGCGMRRGTLLARDAAQPIPENFVLTGTYSLPYFSMLCAHIAQLRPQYKTRLRAFSSTERWVGDRGCGGLGELLIARR